MAKSVKKHKKLSMKRVFNNTKMVSYSDSIELLKSMMPSDEAIIANYIGAIKKTKKITSRKKKLA